MLFNLLGKTLLENSIGALKHHLKKKEVARNTEIECQKDIQIERINNQEDLLKMNYSYLVLGNPKLTSNW